MINNLIMAAMLVAAEPDASTILVLKPHGVQYMYQDVNISVSEQDKNDHMFFEEVEWLKTRQVTERELQKEKTAAENISVHLPQKQEKTSVLFFAFDQSRAKDGEVVKLKLFDAKDTVAISGYASKEGTDKYNKKLSKRRAEYVASLLKSKGVGIGKIEFFGSSMCSGNNMPQCRKVEVKKID